jgi:hypothetical protein
MVIIQHVERKGWSIDLTFRTLDLSTHSVLTNIEFDTRHLIDSECHDLATKLDELLQTAKEEK